MVRLRAFYCPAMNYREPLQANGPASITRSIRTITPFWLYATDKAIGNLEYMPVTAVACPAIIKNMIHPERAEFVDLQRVQIPLGMDVCPRVCHTPLLQAYLLHIIKCSDNKFALRGWENRKYAIDLMAAWSNCREIFPSLLLVCRPLLLI